VEGGGWELGLCRRAKGAAGQGMMLFRVGGSCLVEGAGGMAKELGAWTS
jgi:hypothetical protein